MTNFLEKNISDLDQECVEADQCTTIEYTLTPATIVGSAIVITLLSGQSEINHNDF